MSSMRLALSASLLASQFFLGCGSSTSPTEPMDAPAPAPPVPDPTASYRVSFDASWSAATHPNRFPPNPHFSPLVGATHDAAIRFWEEGETASEGIERMAELGSTSPLDDIVRDAIERGEAEFLLRGGGIAVSPGAVSLDFDISREHPYVTLVSMIAPSPDWFVGISAQNLLDSGDWPAVVVFELSPYDAGTDSGAIYTAPDRDTRPPEPIRRITAAPFAVDGQVAPLGTFTFTRLGSAQE